MTAAGRRPRVLLAGARALFVGPGLELSPHSNAVATLAVALDRPFELDFLDDSSPAASARTFARALIPANRRHHLRARGDMGFLYLDAGDDALRVLGDGPRDLDTDAGLREHLREVRDGRAVTAADFERVLLTLGLRPRDCEPGPLAEVVRRIDRRPQDFRTVAQAARLAGLSASRFQARFRETTGVPFRRYRLWRRMAAVARSLAAGATLTEAALHAGFAGSAHLSASFRAMFGLKPSLLVSLGTDIRELDC